MQNKFAQRMIRSWSNDTILMVIISLVFFKQFSIIIKIIENKSFNHLWKNNKINSISDITDVFQRWQIILYLCFYYFSMIDSCQKIKQKKTLIWPYTLQPQPQQHENNCNIFVFRFFCSNNVVCLSCLCFINIWLVYKNIYVAVFLMF